MHSESLLTSRNLRDVGGGGGDAWTGNDVRALDMCRPATVALRLRHGRCAECRKTFFLRFR